MDHFADGGELHVERALRLAGEATGGAATPPHAWPTVHPTAPRKRLRTIIVIMARARAGINAEQSKASPSNFLGHRVSAVNDRGLWRVFPGSQRRTEHVHCNSRPRLASCVAPRRHWAAVTSLGAAHPIWRAQPRETWARRAALVSIASRPLSGAVGRFGAPGGDFWRLQCKVAAWCGHN